jgi:hypothetical protein
MGKILFTLEVKIGCRCTNFHEIHNYWAVLNGAQNLYNSKVKYRK